MIKKTRITLAAVSLTLLTLMLLDPTGLLRTYVGWLAKIQAVPAVLSLNVVVVVLLVFLTLVMGRFYCSTICPLGILQDLFARLPRRKNRYHYKRELPWLRYAVLVVFVVLMLLGLGSIAGLIAPYSMFGRIVVTLSHPYAVVPVAIAFVSLLVVGFLAILDGRLYCNTICPVGTVLGLISRVSLLKIRIDAEACKNCGLCERNCKSSCIDVKSHSVDASRCVVCGECLERCKFGALSYSVSPALRPASSSEKGVDTGRRAFLVGVGLAAASSVLAEGKMKVDGGLAVIEDKQAPERQTKLTPPGSLSAKHMQQHCTACQLCVSQCPNDVLRPSTEAATLMQPEMSYERGYCRVECTRCSQVCPTGAIQPITAAEKSAIQVGHAVWIRENCIPVANGDNCDNCAAHCPAEAIMMVPQEDPALPHIPVVNESKCIGCGACENLCPARPFSALYVEGHTVHKEI